MTLPKWWLRIPRGIVKVRLPTSGKFPAIDIELYPISKLGNSSEYVPYQNGKLMGAGIIISKRELCDRLKSGMYILIED